MPGRSNDSAMTAAERHLAREVRAAHLPVVAALLRTLVFQRAVSACHSRRVVSRLLVKQLKPGIVLALKQQGFDLVFVTTINVHPAPGQTALLLPKPGAMV